MVEQKTLSNILDLYPGTLLGRREMTKFVAFLERVAKAKPQQAA